MTFFFSDELFKQSVSGSHTRNEVSCAWIFFIISSNGLILGSDETLVIVSFRLFSKLLLTINLVLLQELHMDEEFTLPEMLLILLDTQKDLGLATCTLRGSWWASIVLAIAV